MAETRPTPEELVGWKAVAAYLRVSVRTAQDFEKTRGLPVRRGAGLKAPVFALITELDDWRQLQEGLGLGPATDGEGAAGGENSQPAPKDRSEIEPAGMGGAGSSGTDFANLLDSPFAGHTPHIFLAATLIAAMFATTVIMELVYAYDRYRAVVWKVTPLVLLWTLACVSLAAAINWNCQRRGNPHGLSLAAMALAAGAAINFLAVRPLLPSLPITQASFQTWTAQAAYLKGIIYCTVFSSFFLLVPFNFVIALRRELHRGMHNVVFEVLTRSKTAVAPQGAPFIPVSLFGAMLIGGGIYSLISTAHLLEALRFTRYTNLFILTIQIRWVLFLLLGVECCWWYYSALAQLKRECMVLTGLTGSEHKETRPKRWTEFET